MCFLGATSLSACAVFVNHVRGPDGESAHLIQCRFWPDCYAKANELCPDGYALRGGVTTSLLVSCNDALPEESPGVALTSSQMPAPSREDTRTCEAASAYADAFGTYWAKLAPGAKRLGSATLPDDFVAVCRALPDNVQRCMHEKYRAVHDVACNAVLTRLDASDRGRIEGLFFEAPEG